SGGGRRVNEKNKDVAAKDGVSPFVTDKSVVKGKQSSLVDTSIRTAKVDKLSSLDDTTVLGSFPPLSMLVTTTAEIEYLYFVYTGSNGIDVVIPVESILTISDRFANTTYDFFLGKRVAYHVVANYVRNTWGKYRLIRSIFSSSTRLFSFQFSSMDELDAMLENVWVKLHGVPVTAFSNDGLSTIATKLGIPLMLDSYTADMCMQSWGRSSYAKVMIELCADVELKDNIVVAMPRIKRDGYYTCNIRVEYEWKLPRCACCKVFRHVHEECLKNIGADATKTLKKTSQTPKGIPVG
ncbi:putative reverse transcriptase domain-containing protein, partial [Tanacetum coccineum]